jgi:uncharacterized delta-60 repeat protein
MWSLFQQKVRRTSPECSHRGRFRPQLEALEDRYLLSAGALDTTFGTGGLVAGGPIVTAQAVVVYPLTNSLNAGKIVVGGYVPNSAHAFQWALARYNANGTIDSGFGNNGVVISAGGQIGSQSYFPLQVTGLVLQSDGKIVAVGDATVGTNFEFAVARYNSDGSLDATFNGGNKKGGGLIVTDVALNTKNQVWDYTTAVAVQSDGKIDVAGFPTIPTNGVPPADFALVRYNSDGALDPTFGPNGNGIVITANFGSSYDEAHAMAIQSDGKIVLAGGTFNGLDTPLAMAAARYTTGGLLDSSFGTGGIVMGLRPGGSGAASAYGVVIQGDGGIVTAGYSTVGGSDLLTLARLKSNGQLDTAFGSSGFAVNSSLAAAHDGRIPSPNAVVLAANGDLLATGRTVNSATADFGVAAFLPTGAIDTTFGTNGITTADFAGGSDNAHAIAIQSDGKFLVAGGTTPAGGSTSSALARFLAPNTKIGSLTGSSANGNVTLAAANVLNSNPTSTIIQVYFYLQNPDLSLTLLGAGTNNNGIWANTFSETAYGLTSGATYTFVAQAVDSNGILSDPSVVSLTVF